MKFFAPSAPAYLDNTFPFHQTARPLQACLTVLHEMLWSRLSPCLTFPVPPYSYKMLRYRFRQQISIHGWKEESQWMERICSVSLE